MKGKKIGGGGGISFQIKLRCGYLSNTIHKRDRKSPFHSEPSHKQEICPV